MGRKTIKNIEVKLYILLLSVCVSKCYVENQSLKDCNRARHADI